MQSPRHLCIILLLYYLTIIHTLNFWRFVSVLFFFCFRHYFQDGLLCGHYSLSLHNQWAIFTCAIFPLTQTFVAFQRTDNSVIFATCTHWCDWSTSFPGFILWLNFLTAHFNIMFLVRKNLLMHNWRFKFFLLSMIHCPSRCIHFQSCYQLCLDFVVAQISIFCQQLKNQIIVGYTTYIVWLCYWLVTLVNIGLHSLRYSVNITTNSS